MKTVNRAGGLQQHIFQIPLQLLLLLMFFFGSGIEAMTAEPRPADQAVSLSSAPVIKAMQFRFEGNTVFSNEELAQITDPYLGRVIDSEDIQEIRHCLNLYYIQRGYINSGVIIPNQKVTDGIITYRIIEGRLDQVVIRGNNRLRSGYIRNRLEREAGAPLNIARLKDQIYLLHNNPLIKKLNAELEPGPETGQSVLNVQVTEACPYRFGFAFDNARSPSNGGYQGVVHAEHNNISGWGDRLGVRYGITEGMDEYAAEYSIPLNRYDTTLKLAYDKNSAGVIEAPFDRIDIDSDSDDWRISLSHPLIHTPGSILTLGITGEYRKNKTYLLGELFSFSPGVQNGESTVSAIRLFQEWMFRDANQVFGGRSTVSFGIDAFDATINSSGPDGRFMAWLLQLQWARRFESLMASQLIARGTLQMTPDPLLASEKFSLGGVNTVRGYRENQMVRDNGGTFSLEGRIPVIRLPLPGVSLSPDEGGIQVCPFFDWGHAWNTEEPDPGPRTLYGAGLGFRWDPGAGIHGEIYWGFLKRRLSIAGDDLQDEGIHFQVSWDYGA